MQHKFCTKQQTPSLLCPLSERRNVMLVRARFIFPDIGVPSFRGQRLYTGKQETIFIITCTHFDKINKTIVFSFFEESVFKPTEHCKATCLDYFLVEHMILIIDIDQLLNRMLMESVPQVFIKVKSSYGVFYLM